MRTAFNKNGGTLGGTGSVTFMFDHVGAVGYPADAASAEEMFEAALEAGADDCESGEAGHEVICAADQLSDVRDALEARFGPPASAKLVWRPQNLVPVDEDTADQLSDCSRRSRTATTCRRFRPTMTSPRTSWKNSAPEGGVP